MSRWNNLKHGATVQINYSSMVCAPLSGVSQPGSRGYPSKVLQYKLLTFELLQLQDLIGASRPSPPSSRARAERVSRGHERLERSEPEHRGQQASLRGRAWSPEAGSGRHGSWGQEHWGQDEEGHDGCVQASRWAENGTGHYLIQIVFSTLSYVKYLYRHIRFNACILKKDVLLIFIVKRFQLKSSAVLKKRFAMFKNGFWKILTWEKNFLNTFWDCYL